MAKNSNVYRLLLVVFACTIFFPNLLVSQTNYKVVKYFNSLTSCTDSSAFIEDFDCVHFEINYPQFIDDSYKGINELIKNFIYRNFFVEPYNDFDKYSLEFFKEYEIDQRDFKSPEWWFTVDADTVYINAKTISIPFYGYVYTGGAHGALRIVTLNYNIITSEVFYFEDLVDYDNYNEFNIVINSIIRETPNEDRGIGRIENDIDFFDWDNYSYDNIDKRFLLKDNSIMILLDYYDESFRKGANFEIEIPYSRIKNLLKMEYQYLAN